MAETTSPAPAAPPGVTTAWMAASGLAAPAVAAVCALAVLVAQWRGVDLATHVDAIDQYRRYGMTLWDSQSFGGRWLLGYSVLYAPVASAAGLRLTALASAVLAAWSFDRLLRPHFTGRVVWVASACFAVGTVAQVAIGQLPYLLGEALALVSLVLARRRWWVPAALAAAAATLASPLAGAFLALAAGSWALACWPRHRVGLGAIAAAAMVPGLPLQVLFPQGTMPFSLGDFALVVTAFAAVALLVPARERALRIGAALYTGAIVVSYLAPSAMGANIVRLGGCVALPLALCATRGVRRMAAVAALAPVLVLTSAPVWASATTGRADDSARAAYYTPLVTYLAAHARPSGRVEVVPTALHWESVYVAPTMALARGPERQTDTLDDPIFYRPGSLTAAGYRAWLAGNGVRYVALPDARLDPAGRAEAALVSHPVPGLVEVWHDPHWRLFAVTGSPGIVTGPATLVHLGADQLVVRTTGPGRVTIDVRPPSRWTLDDGPACLEAPTPDAVVLDARGPGVVTLGLHLLTPHDARSPRC